MLSGTCDKTIKGEEFNTYEITHFSWDLRSSNIELVVRYGHKSKKSFRNENIIFENIVGDVDINELIDKTHKLIQGK